MYGKKLTPCWDLHRSSFLRDVLDLSKSNEGTEGTHAKSSHVVARVRVRSKLRGLSKHETTR